MVDTPYNPYAPSKDEDLFGSASAAAGNHNWTEGLPHDFKGWGPQTPDPDEGHADVKPPEGDLVWRGKDDDRHFVWRFDVRRHH